MLPPCSKIMAGNNYASRRIGIQRHKLTHLGMTAPSDGARRPGLCLPPVAIGRSLTANLSRASLQGANLRRANLGHADLRGANLTDAILDGTTLTGAQADEATLWPAGFGAERRSEFAVIETSQRFASSPGMAAGDGAQQQNTNSR